ncbi:hypothetical protein G6F57_003699 [Rhizopus arrhizus]|uniref:EF-hand domain-containing protein n=1 Tax=Rhizopus oryzae TaxID=64495 RepID=A0A9P7BVQ7_RHIOR|nr:hypothetical protein G6F23_002853 [Rhizopus arrhizus]KAG1428014.1 hypothetical protein G6F58_000767 [Rhizopus delemar]KAG0770612.1 hypothetical protein G6F24_000070 [Rhizopus arrhizus]KAG0789112.1 hypothetical protein G6F21_006740 [Rhizopus arrhizus]KAG0801643.1 hypothetical protein G6F22_001043 [Rhizopus arrhizus]
MTLLATAMGEIQHQFEKTHMKEAHQMEVADEVSFFKIHDLNKDGFWDEDELMSMYGIERGIDPKAEHIQVIIEEIYKAMDLNKDRFISQDEYITSTFLPTITKQQEEKEKEIKKKSKNKNKKQDKSKKKKKQDADYELVVPAKFRA